MNVTNSKKGEPTMDDENYRDLVLKLWELSRALEAMQKLLNKSFLNEFVELDRIELEKRLIDQYNLPF
jgi:hypothetical protein